jgi:glycerol-3-phosphate dehydrogenase (NAD(P)+)
MRIAILGGGSWGTALAVHLSKKHDVKVWEFFEDRAKEMQKKRKNSFLKGVILPKNILVSSVLGEVVLDCELVLVVVPSDKVEVTIKKAGKLLNRQSVIICSKGFASKLRLLSEVVKENVAGKVYCLYGPTHAEEVSKGMFAGMVLAGGSGKELLVREIERKNLKVELSNDIIGVQVAASLKNVMAILVGMINGAGLGDNATAYTLTKGLAEIKEVGLKMGAKKDTFYGLAGLGDLIVTCGSKHSRNRHLGWEMGQGKKFSNVLSGMKMVTEGVNAAKRIPLLEKKFGLKLPVLSSVNNILFKNKKLKNLIERM